MRGADALVRTLEAADISRIFALSGNQIMPVFDAIFDSNIRLIHTRHEAATVYMAEAHAQISGGVGVALVTAGGGLGNAVGALIAAQASDTPLLLLSGDSPVVSDGHGAFQEVNQTIMTSGVTKASRRIMHVDEMVETVAWAIDLATSGRNGPVHLALPADVLKNATSVLNIPAAQPIVEPARLSKLKALQAADRPLIILGPAFTETRAPGLAAELRNILHAPVIAMESPRGLNDPALGHLSQVATEVDYVLCLGKPVDYTLRFGDSAQWPKVGQWDVVIGDESQLKEARANLGPRLGSATFDDPHAFAKGLTATGKPYPTRSEWINHVATLCAVRINASSDDGISPQDICQVVQDQIDRMEKATLICDGGEFGQWAQAGLQAPKRIINGISGVIGGGVGYAIGAKMADPASYVFALMGDGTIGFHLSEFETAVREGLPFVAVIGNDNRWNAEYLIQARSFGADRLIGCDLSAARYDLVVKALGGFGAYVTQVDQLAAALTQAVQSQLPACINVAMIGQPAPSF